MRHGKEIIMKNEFKSTAGKVSWSILALVVVGSVLISGIADLSGSGIMTKAFVLFLGAILVMQVVPALMLISAMFKGVASIFNKKTVEQKK
jgi:hypothetical protein